MGKHSKNFNRVDNTEKNQTELKNTITEIKIQH